MSWQRAAERAAVLHPGARRRGGDVVVAAVVVAVVALTSLVLLGWYTGSERLTALPAGGVAMKPNAALALLVLAVVLGIGATRRLGRVASAGVVALSAVTLVEYALGVSTWVDQLLPGVDLHGASAQMALNTAMALGLLATALAAHGAGAPRTTQVSALSALAVGYVAVLGYAYDVSTLYQVGGLARMALHTAVAVVLLSVGALVAAGDRGIVALLRDSGSAGRFTRWMLPFLLLVPPVLGWLRLRGEDLGWYDVRFGVALLVLSMTVAGLATTWRVSLRMRRFDAERDRVDGELRVLNEQLERAVVERTEQLRATAERLSTLIAVAPVGIVELDAEGALLRTNEQWVALSGQTEQQAQGEGWAAAVHPDDRERIVAGWSAAVASCRPFQDSLRFVTPTGSVTWVQVATEPLRVGDVVTGHLAAVTDVTALRRAQQSAATAEAQLAAAFAASPLGSAIVAPDGTVQQANARLAELVGDTSGPLEGSVLEEVFVPDALLEGAAWRSALLDGTLVSHRSERRLRAPGGVETWALVSVAPIEVDGRHVGLLYQMEDITARRLSEARAQHLALHDPLTDLPNRSLLLDRLRQSLAQAARYGRGVGVLFVDLDRFKVVNDTLGHAAGDTVLVAVSARLQAAARATDTVSRLGGDEFVVVLPDVGSHRDVLEIAEKARAAIVAPIPVGGQQVTVDASVGVAFGVGQDGAESLLQAADLAMYRAKERGRGRLEVFDDDLRGRVQRRLDVELDLRHALDRDQIETWYQPIVDLACSRTVAFEALVRWRRPHHGIVLPDHFIEVAEETGTIAGIGAAVLTQACVAAAASPAGEAVSVNVSAKQFVNVDFGQVVDRALERSGLAPERLWLELTESTVVQAIDSAARTFQALRSQGVRLAIDDFGTGYSSFSHLRSFRVDLLKIDREFVVDVEQSAYDRAIVEGILRLAESLDLDVVAEGVETQRQRDVLHELGCRYAQGYLFARAAPVPVQPLHWSGTRPSDLQDRRPDATRRGGRRTGGGPA